MSKELQRQAAVYTSGGGELYMLGEGFPDEPEGVISVYGHIHELPFASANNKGRPYVGDTAVFTGKSGMQHHFRFIEVEHCRDPREMYTGSARRFKVLGPDGETLWEAPQASEKSLLAKISAAAKSLLGRASDRAKGAA